MEYLNAFLTYVVMVFVFFLLAQKTFELNDLDRRDLRFFPNMFFMWPTMVLLGIINIDHPDKRDEVAIGSGFVWLIGGIGFYKTLNCQMPEWKFFLYYSLATFVLLVVSAIAFAALIWGGNQNEEEDA